MQDQCAAAASQKVISVVFCVSVIRHRFPSMSVDSSHQAPQGDCFCLGHLLSDKSMTNSAYAKTIEMTFDLCRLGLCVETHLILIIYACIHVTTFQDT